ncbi:unnamed protein product [Sphagnum jensenii]|uniref:Uncharacterized protein n=1 Tax=Sphagnum jensenii TaxID=128206 RepID=A0ABP1BD94_9BRYO
MSLAVRLSRSMLEKGLIRFVSCSRLDMLDPALLQPGQLDRKVEFGLPDLESRTQIFKIHTRTMNFQLPVKGTCTPFESLINQ